MLLFPEFEEKMIATDSGNIFCRVGPIVQQKKALLMLHGYPQTGACWHKVASDFAKEFICIIPDLTGYGRSDFPKNSTEKSTNHSHGDQQTIPPVDPQVIPIDTHISPYSKRAMGAQLMQMMTSLGFDSFSILGHDRGARVTYRMALDYPQIIDKIGIIEVIPTSTMWENFDANMSIAAYHWPFLAQPYPLPEKLIAADPRFYIEHTLRSWTKDQSLSCFAAEALEEYLKAGDDPRRIHAFCEDYRAGAEVDWQLDKADFASGMRLKQPLHFLWGGDGFPGQTGDPGGIWRAVADQVSDQSFDSGHFGQEENPQAIIDNFIPFFR